MGNCYSSGAGTEFEANLSSNTVGRPNQRQHAAGIEIEDVQIPEITLTKEEEQRQILQARGNQLNEFVQNLQSSHPDFYREKVHDLVLKHGNFDYFANQPENIDFIDPQALEYREAVVAEDGSLFEGTWNKSTNKFEGFGVLVSADGTLFEGFFLDGKYAVKGRLIQSADGDVYFGEFSNGLRSGHGTLTTEEGTVYVGFWYSDQKWGQGKETWVDGAYYEGHFQKGLKHGQGYFQWQDKSNYNGEFVENQIQGYGTYKWSDNRSYVGNWRENKMEGFGIFTWEDGRKYEGNYVDDKKDGNGKFTWPDGRIYDGEWKDGRQNGVGTYTYPDGRVRKGEWVDGKRQKWLGEPTIDQSRSNTIKEPNNVDEKEATVN